MALLVGLVAPSGTALAACSAGLTLGPFGTCLNLSSDGDDERNRDDRCWKDAHKVPDKKGLCYSDYWTELTNNSAHIRIWLQNSNGDLSFRDAVADEKLGTAPLGILRNLFSVGDDGKIVAANPGPTVNIYGNDRKLREDFKITLSPTSISSDTNGKVSFNITYSPTDKDAVQQTFEIPISDLQVVQFIQYIRYIQETR